MKIAFKNFISMKNYFTYLAIQDRYLILFDINNIIHFRPVIFKVLDRHQKAIVKERKSHYGQGEAKIC